MFDFESRLAIYETWRVYGDPYEGAEEAELEDKDLEDYPEPTRSEENE